MPSVVTCFGADDDTTQGDAATYYKVNQLFCAGGDDGTYGGYFPHGIPNDLTGFSKNKGLSLGQYPGQVSSGNWTGIYYEAQIDMNSDQHYPGEWSRQRCYTFFGEVMVRCNGYFGGVAVDDQKKQRIELTIFRRSHKAASHEEFEVLSVKNELVECKLSLVLYQCLRRGLAPPLSTTVYRISRFPLT